MSAHACNCAVYASPSARHARSSRGSDAMSTRRRGICREPRPPTVLSPGIVLPFRSAGGSVRCGCMAPAAATTTPIVQRADGRRCDPSLVAPLAPIRGYVLFQHYMYAA
eukprot:3818720-Pleurochrysis_carterae.AAC.1